MAVIFAATITRMSQFTIRYNVRTTLMVTPHMIQQVLFPVGPEVATMTHEPLHFKMYHLYMLLYIAVILKPLPAYGTSM